MHFIENIVEPTKLLMTWSSSEQIHRTRYTIAELHKVGDKVTLRYLANTKDFREAQKKGFESYPAFPNTDIEYDHGVVDVLMRRLAPKSRSDYSQYLTNYRIKPETKLSNFGLLGYTGARLPSDGFAIINPFFKTEGPFEFLVEIAGYRHLSKTEASTLIGSKASFRKNFDNERQEDTVEIFINETHTGYITRALVPDFIAWMKSGRIKDSWVEKINGNPGHPLIFLFVKFAASA